MVFQNLLSLSDREVSLTIRCGYFKDTASIILVSSLSQLAWNLRLGPDSRTAHSRFLRLITLTMTFKRLQNSMTLVFSLA
jgi:hypothetical protein